MQNTVAIFPSRGGDPLIDIYYTNISCWSMNWETMPCC